MNDVVALCFSEPSFIAALAEAKSPRTLARSPKLRLSQASVSGEKKAQSLSMYRPA